MFRKESVSLGRPSTNIVAADSTLSGSLDVPGSLDVLGQVNGPIRVADTLYVGPSAIVEGDVYAKSARIEGQLFGNLVAREGVDLISGSKLSGDVFANSFRIEDGAIFKGQCHMGEQGRDTDDGRG